MSYDLSQLKALAESMARTTRAIELDQDMVPVLVAKNWTEELVQAIEKLEEEKS